MNNKRALIRLFAAVGATFALTLAACGADDDADDPAQATVADDATGTDDDDATTIGDGAAEVPTQPAAIAVDAQESDGATIVVASIDLPAPGFIAVHSDADGSPGPVIGTSDLLAAGTSTDVSVVLAEPLTGDATVFPMVHVDTNDNGVYEFGEVEGVDGPGVTADGDVAVIGAAITVVGGGGESAASETITIAEFAFSGATEVSVGTTVVVTNTDGTAHTWSALDGTFDSGALESGDTFEFTFTEAGEFDYLCNFHPSMTGTITVTP